MKKILSVYLVFLLIICLIPSFSTEETLDEECAGLVATGSVVVDGRNIFMKNRHQTGENNKPSFYHPAWATHYYYMVAGMMGFNDVGLGIGNFAISESLLHVGGTTDGTVGYADAMSNILANFSTVDEAVAYLCAHVTGSTEYGIVGREPGVGAVFDISGKNYNVTWINNTYAGLANAFYSNGGHDGDNNDVTIDNLCQSLVTTGDHKISIQEVCQKAGKNVRDKEKGTSTFSSSGEITKSSCVSSLIVYSGLPTYDGSLNMAWMACGRQPLVGLYLPLGASYLTSTSDIPTCWRNGGGMEDYFDPKIIYTTTAGAQGTDNFYCSRVREVQAYANGNENYTFSEYEVFLDKVNQYGWSKQTSIDNLELYADTVTDNALNSYISNTTYNEGVTKSLNVISPNGGEVWNQGTLHDITWSSEGIDNINILLYKNGVLESTLVTNTPDDGSYSWLIPNSLSGNTFKIRISDVDSSTYDESNNYFSITEQTVICYQCLGIDLITQTFTGTTCPSGWQPDPPDCSSNTAKAEILLVNIPNEFRYGDNITITATIKNIGSLTGVLFGSIKIEGTTYLGTKSLSPGGEFNVETTVEMIYTNDITIHVEAGHESITDDTSDVTITFIPSVTCYYCNNSLLETQTFDGLTTCPEPWEATQPLCPKIECFMCNGETLINTNFSGSECPLGWYPEAPICNVTLCYKCDGNQSIESEFPYSCPEGWYVSPQECIESPPIPTPGFEFLLLIISIIIFLFYRRSKHEK